MSSTLFLLISYAIFLQKVCLLNFCKNIIFIKKNICHKNSCFWQPSSQGCFSNFCHRNLLVNHVKTLSPNTSAPTQRPEIFAQNFITFETYFSSIYSFIIILFFFCFFFFKKKTISNNIEQETRLSRQFASEIALKRCTKANCGKVENSGIL